MKKRRVLFVLSSLGAGGAQRVLLNVMRYIDHDKFEPHLALTQKGGEFEHMLPDGVEAHYLSGRARNSVFSLAKLLRREKFDVAIGTLNYVNTTLGFASIIAGHPTPLIMRLSNYESERLKGQPVRRLLLKAAYAHGDFVLSTTGALSEDAEKNFGVSKKKIRLIHNAIDVDSVESMSRELIKENLGPGPFVIGVGSLVARKGFPFLIDAFAKLVQKTKATLLILGEGVDEEMLMAHASQLGVRDKVAFLGYRDNPFQYMRHSDVFVLSSLYEGFPNVVVEAMASGTAVVASDGPSGPREIITDGVDGLIVPLGDDDSLAEAMRKIIEDRKLRLRLEKAGRKRVEDFRVEKIVRRYESLFEEVIGQ